jgi:RimJ/RimL family protein N-acetyltransferase
MKLEPLEDGHVELVAGWLAAPQNARWLRFGAGVERLSPASLKMMAQRDLHVLRLFSVADRPIGVVALSDVDRQFGTATLWYVLGDLEHRGRGHTSRAVSRLLSIGFSELGLVSVNAWVVEDNTSSLRVLARNNFRIIGRQRQCHRLEGRPRDRLLFDLVASEHEEKT